MDRLPPDISTNIFSRLPIKLVLRSRSVCKGWCSFIDDPEFRESYPVSNNHNPTSLILFPGDPEVCHGELYLVQIHDEIPTTPSVVEFSKLNVPFPHENDQLKLVGFSNGFLCFASYHGSYSCNQYPLYVCNPVTEECVGLPDINLGSDTDMEDGDYVIKNIDSGFGWVSSTNEFKVVLLVTSYHVDGDVKAEVYVHTLGSTEWRTKEPPPEEYTSEGNRNIDLGNGPPMVFVNTSLHLMILEEDNNVEEEDDEEEEDDDDEEKFQVCIMSFDLEDETFGFVPAPDLNCLSIDCYECFQIGSLEGHLAVMDGTHDDRDEIWIMKNYNVVRSWRKEFVISRNFIDGRNLHQPLCTQKSGEVVLLFGNRVLISFNLKTKRSTSLGDAKLLKWDLKCGPLCEAVPHVGSLTSPKIVFRVGEGEESSFESENEESETESKSKGNSPEEREASEAESGSEKIKSTSESEASESEEQESPSESEEQESESGSGESEGRESKKRKGNS